MKISEQISVEYPEKMPQVSQRNKLIEIYIFFGGNFSQKWLGPEEIQKKFPKMFQKKIPMECPNKFWNDKGILNIFPDKFLQKNAKRLFIIIVWGIFEGKYEEMEMEKVIS